MKHRCKASARCARRSSWPSPLCRPAPTTCPSRTQIQTEAVLSLMAAPTLTRSALATALRADDDDSDIAAQLDRILETAIALVSAVTTAAPLAVANEATIRVGAWLYDTDAASARNGDPLRSSGASQLLSRWRPTALVGPGRGRLMNWLKNIFIEPETRQANFTDQIVAGWSLRRRVVVATMLD